MADTPNQKPGGAGNRSRTLSLWILAFLVPLVFIQLATGGKDDSPLIDYSIYSQQLAADNIARVTIVGGREVNGEFKNGVLVEGREARSFTTKWPVSNSESEVERLREKQVAIKAEDPRVSFLALVLQMLPWIIIFGIWIFLFRQMQAGGNKAFSFGKSKAKLLSGDTPKVTFADVAGADEAKVELQEIIARSRWIPRSGQSMKLWMRSTPPCLKSHKPRVWLHWWWPTAWAASRCVPGCRPIQPTIASITSSQSLARTKALISLVMPSRAMHGRFASAATGWKTWRTASPHLATDASPAFTDIATTLSSP